MDYSKLFNCNKNQGDFDDPNKTDTEHSMDIIGKNQGGGEPLEKSSENSI